MNRKLLYLLKRVELKKIFQYIEYNNIAISIKKVDNDQILFNSLKKLDSETIVETVEVLDGIELKIEIDKKGEKEINIVKMLIKNSDNIIDILETIARQWKVINFHSHIIEKMGSFTSVEETCGYILNHLMTIISVNRASILIDNGENFLIGASKGLPKHIVELKYLSISGMSGWVFNKGQELVINSDKDLPEEILQHILSRNLKKHSFQKNFVSEPIAIVPLEIHRDILGVLNLTDKIDETPFTSEDLKIVKSIATEIALTIKTAKLIESVKKTEQLKMEINLAEKIQKSILPTTFPNLSPIYLYGKSIAPNRVGGDFYGYFLENGTLYITIADVSGHNFSSSLLVNNFRSYLKATLGQNLKLSKLVEKINKFVCEDVGESGRFVTVVLLSIDMETGEIEYVNGGHNPPFIVKQNGEIEMLEVGGMPLGFFDDNEYEQFSTKLNSEDLLILYTDGFEESEDKNGVFFGKDRLIKLVDSLKNYQIDKIVDTIFLEIKKFTDNNIQDDLTAFGVKYVK